MIGGSAGPAPCHWGRGSPSGFWAWVRSSVPCERGLLHWWPCFVAPGLLASRAASAREWAGEVGRSEPEPALGESRRSLNRRPQSGCSVPTAGARMLPGATGWQVPMHSDPGLAKGKCISGSPLSLFPTPHPFALREPLLPPTPYPRELTEREVLGLHSNPHGKGA